MNPSINCTTTAGKGSKQKRCGRCYGCRAKDCGVCKHCLDKKKFGGPNRLKQCCIHKKCADYKDMAHKQSLDSGIIIHVHVHGTSNSTIQENAQTTRKLVFIRVSHNHVGKLGESDYCQATLHVHVYKITHVRNAKPIH